MLRMQSIESVTQGGAVALRCSLLLFLFALLLALLLRLLALADEFLHSLPRPVHIDSEQLRGRVEGNATQQANAKDRGEGVRCEQRRE